MAVFVVGFYFSLAEEIRERWARTRSFGGFLKDYIIGDFVGVPASERSVYIDAMQSQAKKVGAEAKNWVALRGLPYESTEEFLRKCLRLKVSMESLDRESAAGVDTCRRARQSRDFAKDPEFLSLVEANEATYTKYRQLVAAQRSQLDAIEKWSSGWSDASGPLANVEDLAREQDVRIQIEFSQLLHHIKTLMEKTSGEKYSYDPDKEYVGILRRPPLPGGRLPP